MYDVSSTYFFVKFILFIFDLKYVTDESRVKKVGGSNLRTACG